MSEPSDSRTWRDDEFTPWMITIRAGEFRMGASPGDKFANDTERPEHRVTLRSFAMGRFAVTVGEYRAFRPRHAPEDVATLPVVEVSWDDASAYCDWLTARTGRQYRLPGEAEWEFACRAGSATPFSCGWDIQPQDANYYYSETGKRVGPGRRSVGGMYPANTLGLYDLHGNVCEWVEDAWHANFCGAPTDGAAWRGPDEEMRKVIRGGAWDYLPRLLRSAWRDGVPRDCHRDNIGFRVATSDLHA